MNKQTSLKSGLTGELPLGNIHTASGGTCQKLCIFCEHHTIEGKLLFSIILSVRMKQHPDPETQFNGIFLKTTDYQFL